MMGSAGLWSFFRCDAASGLDLGMPGCRRDGNAAAIRGCNCDENRKGQHNRDNHECATSKSGECEACSGTSMADPPDRQPIGDTSRRFL
ncbi:hypothetical protein BJX65DRAFT_89837 [Aspergillus insuetus]